MTELNFLSGGAKRPVVYFTQGHGEPAIAEAPKQDDIKDRLSVVHYLKERKFDVKPLYFEPGKKPDLSDAAIVVVAAPTKPFSPNEVANSSQYMTPEEKRADRHAGGDASRFPRALTARSRLRDWNRCCSTSASQADEPERLFSIPNPPWLEFPPLSVPGLFLAQMRRIEPASQSTARRERFYPLQQCSTRAVRTEPASDIFTGINLFSTHVRLGNISR